MVEKGVLLRYQTGRRHFNDYRKPITAWVKPLFHILFHGFLSSTLLCGKLHLIPFYISLKKWMHKFSGQKFWHMAHPLWSIITALIPSWVDGKIKVKHKKTTRPKQKYVAITKSNLQKAQWGRRATPTTNVWKQKEHHWPCAPFWRIRNVAMAMGNRAVKKKEGLPQGVMGTYRGNQGWSAQGE